MIRCGEDYAIVATDAGGDGSGARRHVDSRKFAGVGEPVGSEVEVSSSSTSKTSVSDIFIERTPHPRSGISCRVSWRTCAWG